LHTGAADQTDQEPGERRRRWRDRDGRRRRLPANGQQDHAILLTDTAKGRRHIVVGRSAEHAVWLPTARQGGSPSDMSSTSCQRQPEMVLQNGIWPDEQHRLRHPPKRWNAPHTIESSRLPLVPERASQAARRHEQIHPHARRPSGTVAPPKSICSCLTAPALNRRSRRPVLQPSLRLLMLTTIAPFGGVRS